MDLEKGVSGFRDKALKYKIKRGKNNNKENGELKSHYAKFKGWTHRTGTGENR